VTFPPRRLSPLENALLLRGDFPAATQSWRPCESHAGSRTAETSYPDRPEEEDPLPYIHNAIFLAIIGLKGLGKHDYYKYVISGAVGGKSQNQLQDAIFGRKVFCLGHTGLEAGASLI